MMSAFSASLSFASAPPPAWHQVAPPPGWHQVFASAKYQVYQDVAAGLVAADATGLVAAGLVAADATGSVAAGLVAAGLMPSRPQAPAHHRALAPIFLAPPRPQALAHHQARPPVRVTGDRVRYLCYWTRDYRYVPGHELHYLIKIKSRFSPHPFIKIGRTIE